MHKSRLEDEMVEKWRMKTAFLAYFPTQIDLLCFLPIIGTISKSLRILDWGHKPLIPTNINNKRP